MISNQSPANSYHTAGVNLAFSYAAGETASRFLVALRDEKRIFGTRCPACRRVLVPARSFCPRCFVETTDWIEVGPAGTLAAFAPFSSPQSSPNVRARADSSLAQGEGPGVRLIHALIRLDGADTSLVHFVGGADPGVLRVKLRVTAVFAETRTGSILDIAYFKVRTDAPPHLSSENNNAYPI